jgi:DNA-binding transcriptional LysR family regulator
VPRRVSTCDSLSIMAQLVSGGFAVSLLPVRMLDEELASGRVRRLEAARQVAPHTMYFAWRASELGGGVTSILTIVQGLLAQKAVLQPIPGGAVALAGPPP